MSVGGVVQPTKTACLTWLTHTQTQPNWVRQTWNDIYSQPEWQDEKLKFYWRSLPLVLCLYFAPCFERVVLDA